MKKVCDFIKEAGTYFLATTEDGKPRVRPFGTVNIFEDRLYIQTGKSKAVAQQMLANPAIEICAMKGMDWVRVSGEAVLDDRVEAKRDMLDAYPDLKAMYDAEDENTAVFYLKNATAVFSNLMKGELERVTF